MPPAPPSIKSLTADVKMHLCASKFIFNAASVRMCCCLQSGYQAYTSAPLFVVHPPHVNWFHAKLGGKTKGRGGKISPSVISMALLTNRIESTSLSCSSKGGGGVRDEGGVRMEGGPTQLACSGECAFRPGCDGRCSQPTVAWRGWSSSKWIGLVS